MPSWPYTNTLSSFSCISISVMLKQNGHAINGTLMQTGVRLTLHTILTKPFAHHIYFKVIV